MFVVVCLLVYVGVCICLPVVVVAVVVLLFIFEFVSCFAATLSFAVIGFPVAIFAVVVYNTFIIIVLLTPFS